MIDLTDLSIYVGCVVEYIHHEYTESGTLVTQLKRATIVDTDKFYVYIMRPQGVQQLARGDIIDIKAPLTESELLIRRL